MSECYRRIELKLRWQLLSPMRIGTGDDVQIEEKTVALMATDNDGVPYLPASTLRGSLRASAGSAADTLFGEINVKGGGQMGAVWVYDAHSVERDIKPLTNSRTAIDAVTRTAANHQLFSYEVAPAGTTLDSMVLVEAAQEPIPASLLSALSTAIQEGEARVLGGGKGVGHGRVSVQIVSCRALSDQDFLNWLSGDKPLESCLKEIKFPKAEPIESSWTHYPFTLNAGSRVLVNDPQRVKEEALQNGSAPDLMCQLRDGQTCVPGSSIRGWTRARCRRILGTIEPLSLQSGTADSLLDQFFGDHRAEGLIRFDDAVAVTENDGQSIQFFNAIDRFHGGVKNGALFNVCASTASAFVGGCHLAKPRLENWMRLLLIYLMRDAEEGDLRLGWGQARGYGRLRLVLAAEGWQHYHNKHQLDIPQWHDDLEKQLKNSN
ncbi:RAMP superfamily CRISPR-associated protein [Gammaproteobacteria bacterium]|nr:RAMP superfamily CRISPR-associated protein [Gammaproteobacteria bacterium]